MMQSGSLDIQFQLLKKVVRGIFLRRAEGFPHLIDFLLADGALALLRAFEMKYQEDPSFPPPRTGSLASDSQSSSSFGNSASRSFPSDLCVERCYQTSASPQAVRPWLVQVLL